MKLDNPVKKVAEKRLRPVNIVSPIFEDEYAVYKFYQGFLNVDRVKKANHENAFIVPYSVNGIVVDAFNLTKALPEDIKVLYIGSNIKSLGVNGIGMNLKGNHLKRVVIDHKNQYLKSYKGIVYAKMSVADDMERWKRTKLTSVPTFIPALMDSVYLEPGRRRLEKNTLQAHQAVTDLFVAEDTEIISAYAISTCPNLKRIHVPKTVAINRKAIDLKQKYELIFY